MQLHFYEEMAPGMEYKEFLMEISSFPYHLSHQAQGDGDYSQDGYFQKDHYLGKAVKKDKEIGKIIDRKLKREEVPTVQFTAPTNCPDANQGGVDLVNLYWIEEEKRWLAVTRYWWKENPLGVDECYHGPYKVEGNFARKILEVYELNEEAVEGKDISKISPTELKELVLEPMAGKVLENLITALVRYHRGIDDFDGREARDSVLEALRGVKSLVQQSEMYHLDKRIVPALLNAEKVVELRGEKLYRNPDQKLHYQCKDDFQRVIKSATEKFFASGYNKGFFPARGHGEILEHYQSCLRVKKPLSYFEEWLDGAREEYEEARRDFSEVAGDYDDDRLKFLSFEKRLDRAEDGVHFLEGAIAWEKFKAGFQKI